MTARETPRDFAYRVTAPLVIVRDVGGSMHHLYRGDRLPLNTMPSEVPRLLEVGLITSAIGATDR